MDLLPDILSCSEYVNADAIAAGISPFNPETVAMRAGRLMLERIRTLISQQKDFAFETTLATKSFAPLLKQAQKAGYTVCLMYLWLDSPLLAEKRVADRVSRGGHNIPHHVIHRRYYRGLQNLFSLYMPIVDSWLIYNNSFDKPQLVAKRYPNTTKIVYNNNNWDMINLIGSRNDT